MAHIVHGQDGSLSHEHRTMSYTGGNSENELTLLIKPPSSKLRSRNMGYTLLFSVVWLGLAYGLIITASIRLQPKAPSLGLVSENRPSWAQYSPYFSVDEYRPPPSHCTITQVNLIQRHGARFPTSNAGERIEAAIDKLLATQEFTDPRLRFLANFTYDLGANDLVPFGAAQSFESGEVHFGRYTDLVKHDSLPFVRASSSERVVLSATNWTAGFSAASNHTFNPTLSVILPSDLNDTLDDSSCPNAGDSLKQTNEWLAIYGPPIAAELNEGAPGANLTDADIYSLISLCPFDTVAKETPSPFCDIFSEAAFQGFDYSGDVDKYYKTGYGQALGRVQGVGYVNELLARLTGKPVQDHTQTNSTLDSSPITFPLNRTIYADFSHDNQMIAIYAALGLFPQPQPLDPTRPDPNRTWIVAQMVPFSARMVTEKLECGMKEYVRILVNDAVQPLEFCGATRDGLCELDAFVESQGYARSDGAGDFEKCFN